MPSSPPRRHGTGSLRRCHLKNGDRMSRPVIPWPGGKRRLLKHILPLIPEHTCYVEAFCGGAAFRFAKAPSKVEIINDVHSELVRLYRCLQHHLDEFVRQFRWALTSREMFRWAQLQHTDPLTDIQRAARFYYLQKLSFGSKIAGQTFGVSATTPARLNLLRIEEELSEAHLRLTRVVVEHLPWQEIVERYDRPETFFFFDPPYWETTGYGGAFEFAEYEQLAAAMRAMKGRAILTINDHPAMREVFAGLTTRIAKINYTVGGSRNPKASRELIISAHNSSIDKFAG